MRARARRVWIRTQTVRASTWGCSAQGLAMPHKAMAALECVLEHALALELTMLEARPDATEGWAVFVEVRSREESGDFMYAHVFWSEALARSWTRQAAMEWARSRGELLDEPSARQIVSQGEMGRRTFSTVKIGTEPGMFFGCVAYLDLQTSSALAVVLRDRAVTESKIMELRARKEMNRMYALEQREGYCGKIIHRVFRSLREANRYTREFFKREYFDPETEWCSDDLAERAEPNECGGVAFDDRDDDPPTVVVEVRDVSAGQPVDPFGQMFDRSGRFIRPSLVPFEHTRLSAAERRDVARRAYADVKSKLADVDARLTLSSNERSQPRRGELVEEAFALEAKKYEFETVIANCDRDLADARDDDADLTAAMGRFAIR